MSDLTDQLDAIDARLAAAAPGAITITPSDIRTLLVLARKQQAALSVMEWKLNELGEWAQGMIGESNSPQYGRDVNIILGYTASEIAEFAALEAKP